MFSFAESRAMIVYQLIIILNLNIILVQSVPLIPRTTDGSWDENMVDCAPGGRCWEWSQKKDLAAKPDYYEDGLLRVPNNRQEQDAPVVQSSVAEIPSANRIAKKDVFVSRGWGAGGMPFSVLYLNPHSPRSNINTGVNEIEPVRALPLESHAPRSLTKHSSNRVALRNGAPGQPRRQFSIIPQLFVSYGWGPLGK